MRGRGRLASTSPAGCPSCRGGPWLNTMARTPAASATWARTGEKPRCTPGPLHRCLPGTRDPRFSFLPVALETETPNHAGHPASPGPPFIRRPRTTASRMASASPNERLCPLYCLPAEAPGLDPGAQSRNPGATRTGARRPWVPGLRCASPGMTAMNGWLTRSLYGGMPKPDPNGPQPLWITCDKSRVECPARPRDKGLLIAIIVPSAGCGVAPIPTFIPH